MTLVLTALCSLMVICHAGTVKLPNADTREYQLRLQTGPLAANRSASVELFKNYLVSLQSAALYKFSIDANSGDAPFARSAVSYDTKDGAFGALSEGIRVRFYPAKSEFDLTWKSVSIDKEVVKLVPNDFVDDKFAKKAEFKHEHNFYNNTLTSPNLWQASVKVGELAALTLDTVADINAFFPKFADFVRLGKKTAVQQTASPRFQWMLTGIQMKIAGVDIEGGYQLTYTTYAGAMSGAGNELSAAEFYLKMVKNGDKQWNSDACEAILIFFGLVRCSVHPLSSPPEQFVWLLILVCFLVS
jgi:hypothetical protein